MISFLRSALIRAIRQGEFTLREPRASFSLTKLAVIDRVSALRGDVCALITVVADRLDDDSDTPCVDCGAPGGTHLDTKCESADRLGFVDRMIWQRRKSEFARREQGPA